MTGGLTPGDLRADAQAVAEAALALAAASGRFVTRRVFYSMIVMFLVVFAVLGWIVALTLEQLDTAAEQRDDIVECTSPDPDPADDDPYECQIRLARQQAAFADSFLEAVVDAVREAVRMTGAPEGN